MYCSTKIPKSFLNQGILGSKYSMSLGNADLWGPFRIQESSAIIFTVKFQGHLSHYHSCLWKQGKSSGFPLKCEVEISLTFYRCELSHMMTLSYKLGNIVYCLFLSIAYLFICELQSDSILHHARKWWDFEQNLTEKMIWM